MLVQSQLLTIVEDASGIRIKRRRQPFIADLMNGVFQFLYPAFLIGAFYYWDSRTRSDANLILVFFGLFYGLLWWLPLLLRIGEGLLFPLEVVFDNERRAIKINNQDWADFNEVKTISLLTNVGVMVNRRFRIELTCSRLKYLILVDTPFMGDWSMPSKYLYRIKADRERYGGTVWDDYYSWQPYQTGMGGYDTEDSQVKEVFALYHRLCQMLNLPEVAIPEASEEFRKH